MADRFVSDAARKFLRKRFSILSYSLARVEIFYGEGGGGQGGKRVEMYKMEDVKIDSPNHDEFEGAAKTGKRTRERESIRVAGCIQFLRADKKREGSAAGQ